NGGERPLRPASGRPVGRHSTDRMQATRNVQNCLHPISRVTSRRAKRGAADAFVSLCSLRCFVLVSVVFVLFVGSSAAQSGAQMPDPKQISGVPLPVADVAVGTVTVRVVRGQITSILPG